MARQIIILDVVLSPDNSFTVSGVGWLVAPANRVVPRTTAKSAVPDASAVSWGITATELTQIQNGSVVEVAFETGQLNAGTTVAQVQSALIAKYSAAQAALNAKAAGAKFIGEFFDGTTWTPAP